MKFLQRPRKTIMSKFDKYLDPKESIVLESTGQSPRVFQYWFLTIMLGLLSVGLIWFAKSNGAENAKEDSPILLLGAGGFFIGFVSFLFLGAAIRSYETAKYAITNKRVICKQNWVGGWQLSEVPISSITSFHITEWGCGGTMELKSMDGTYFTLYFVKSPFDIRRKILELQESNKYRSFNQNLPK